LKDLKQSCGNNTSIEHGVKLEALHILQSLLRWKERSPPLTQSLNINEFITLLISYKIVLCRVLYQDMMIIKYKNKLNMCHNTFDGCCFVILQTKRKAIVVAG